MFAIMKRTENEFLYRTKITFQDSFHFILNQKKKLFRQKDGAMGQILKKQGVFMAGTPRMTPNQKSRKVGHPSCENPYEAPGCLVRIVKLLD